MLEAKEYSKHSAFTASSSSTSKAQSHQSTSDQQQDNKSAVTRCFCSQLHRVYKRNDFASKPAKERFDFLISRQLCLNCLNRHLKGKCLSKTTCRTCNKRHRTVFHSIVNLNGKSNAESSHTNISTIRDVKASEKSPSDISDITKVSLLIHSGCAAKSTLKGVLLATTLIWVMTYSRGCDQSSSQLAYRNALNARMAYLRQYTQVPHYPHPVFFFTCPAKILRIWTC